MVSRRCREDSEGECVYCILLFAKRETLYIFAWRMMYRRLTGPMEELGLQAACREAFIPLVSPML